MFHVLLLVACLNGDTEDSASQTFIDADADGYPDTVDCDDNDSAINPGQEESCNGIDDDCNGLIDEDASDARVYNSDADGDGFGSTTFQIASCDGAPDGYVEDSTDCNDLNAEAFPGAPELCNGEDDDCDDEVDEELEETVYFQDSDGDGYGDPSATTTGCDIAEGWSDNDQDCDDLDAGVSPAAEEICGDGLDNDCDGTGEGCGFSDVTGTRDARTTLEGESAGDYFGSPAKNVGDLNANGLDALAVAARGSDLSAEDAGAIYIFDFPVSGTTVGAASADAVLTGEAAGDGVFSVAALGDSNGDGVGDLVVGAKKSDEGGTDAGKVYFVTGPFNGEVPLQDADASWIGVGSGDQAGLVMAHDLNGDGHQDIIVGAQKNDNGGNNAGAVFILNGPFGAWMGDQGLYAADAFIKGEATGDQMGGGMVPVGDVTGDGIGDLLIGAPYAASGGFEDVGAVFQLNGPISGTSSVTDRADAHLVGTDGDQAGWGLASAGDLDGDGLVDFMVNAQRSDNGSDNGNEGAVYLVTQDWTGNEDVSLEDTWAKIQGITTEDKLAAVSGDADFNGDGHIDIVVGSRFHDAGGTDAGSTWVLYGPFSGGTYGLGELTGTQINGAAAGDGFGVPAGSIGDLNGDGADDLAVGARWSDSTAEDAGAAYIFLGSPL